LTENVTILAANTRNGYWTHIGPAVTWTMQYQLITSSYCQFTVPGIHQSFRFCRKK
jgi:hypothetical protein